MDLSQITRIVELMSKHDLTEIDIKSEEIALTIKRERKGSGNDQPQFIAAMPQPMPQIVSSPVSTAAAADAGTSAAGAPTKVENADGGQKGEGEDAGLLAIESPLVGTFYAAPSPDAEAYVNVGDEVTPDTIVCIVEAMKVMNEIKAEHSGIIRKVAVENAQPVEFGQPLFYIEPA